MRPHQHTNLQQSAFSKDRALNTEPAGDESQARLYRRIVTVSYHTLAALLVVTAIVLMALVTVDVAQGARVKPPSYIVRVEPSVSVADHVYTLVIGFQLKPDPAPRGRRP